MAFCNTGVRIGRAQLSIYVPKFPVINAPTATLLIRDMKINAVKI